MVISVSHFQYYKSKNNNDQKSSSKKWITNGNIRSIGGWGTGADATHSEQSKIKSTEAEEHLNVFKDVYACAVGPIIFFVFSIKKFCLIRMISFTLQFIVICVLISIEAKRFEKASEKWQQSLFHLALARSQRE